MATFQGLYIIVILLIAQVFSAPQDINTNTSNKPTKISYEELLYILETRTGKPTTIPRILTPCARAILGCCKDKQMNESCSESLKCGAFFFDENPCADKFVLDALNAAKAFYQQNESGA